MKAVIESKFNSHSESAHAGLAAILNVIISCLTEDQLREEMKSLFLSRYVKNHFEYGFGHNHMWVKEIKGVDRLIFVEF